MAQDDYYYEIQLTNKQLVFYFMAGATGLILSFLAGVMVGRGVDAVGGEVQASRQAQEERVVAEEVQRPAPPAAENLTFAHRLEAEKVDESLEKPASDAGPGKAGSTRPATRGPSPSPRAAATAIPASPKPATSAAAPSAAPGASAVAPVKPIPLPQASAVPVKPSPAPTKPSPSPAKASPVPGAPAAGSPSFAIQVGAFKDKSAADSVASGLKSKGFAAYVDSGQGGLFNVRVGSFAARPEAETVLTRLRDEEKFKPFIVKN